MGVQRRDALPVRARFSTVLDSPRLPDHGRAAGGDREAALRDPVRDDLRVLVRPALALASQRRAAPRGRGPRAPRGGRRHRHHVGARRPRRRACRGREGSLDPERRRHRALRSRGAERAAHEERPLRGAPLGGEEPRRARRGRGPARRPLRSHAHIRRRRPGAEPPRGGSAPPVRHRRFRARRRAPARARVSDGRRRVRVALLDRRPPEGAARGDERRRSLHRLQRRR